MCAGPGLVGGCHRFKPSFLADVKAEVEAEVEGREEHFEYRHVEERERSAEAWVKLDAEVLDDMERVLARRELAGDWWDWESWDWRLEERDWRRDAGAEGDAGAGWLEEREVCFAEADVEGVVLDIEVLMFVGVGGEALGVGAGVSQVVQHANANARTVEGVGVVAVSTAANPAIVASVFAFAATPTSMFSVFFPALFSAGALALFIPAYLCVAGLRGGIKDELGLANGEWLGDVVVVRAYRRVGGVLSRRRRC
ncbi:hypothetical protein M422DRAFT_248732 [Sphaerobolus stellatus SS14]|nr:hypothetical protein M422DRAFT_248732 [Sphaerobolus stellatus SS14]